MKNYVRQFFVLLFLVAAGSAKSQSQSVKDIFSNSGIWEDYGIPVSAKQYPEFKGRLVNINWSDIELAPNSWSWTAFDDDITKRVTDSMPVIFMVYTRMNAPQWIFSNGVPKVNETNASGASIGYSPYYLDPDYNFYFKRMITQVRQHVQTLQPSIRNRVIGVQACFGSTGDQIAYKGNVAKQYEITDAQFDSLFEVYSAYYYNEYKNLTPKITMLSNPDYQDPAQQYWLMANCPGGWTKCGTMGKGFQLNMESDKYGWLYDIMNKPWGDSYIKSRSEIWGDQLNAGWWTKNQYKSMFALMCYCISWGMDWPNETTELLQNPKHDSAFHFFNKYAGQKAPALATNAMCALKDALDASDVARFPESVYGSADRTNKVRYTNIYNSFISYGAKLEDPSVVTGSEYDCLNAKGTNDVGWHLLSGNYDRYLKQIDANITSAGYWNVNPENVEAIYGRFARGFDLAKGKDALYFDLDDGFLRNTALNGKYPVTIEVTYYDFGTGSWQLYYDAQSNSNKASANFTCGNTKTWKKAKIVLSDAYFENRGIRGSDFYIKSSNSANVIFSVVELSRQQPSAAGFIAYPAVSFDTVCLNSTVIAKSFILNASSLNGTNVQVGPLNGFSFSKSANGVFTSTLTYSGYGQNINSTIYVKVNTGTEALVSGTIPITGGGTTAGGLAVKATVLNTSPALNADVTPISCYNKNDGKVDLQPTGGVGPFTYQWTNDLQSYWSATTQDITDCKVTSYNVVVQSSSGCSTKKTFAFTQPDKLVAPSGINGPASVKKQSTGNVFSIKTPNSSFQYVWTLPTGAKITSGQNTSSITVTWGTAGGNVKAQSKNSCGTSASTGKYVSVTNNLAGSVSISSSMEETTETVKLPNMQTIIMPNPAKDIATLQFYAERSYAYSVQVADITGKILLVKKGTAVPGANTEKINVQNFASGYYFVTIINDRGEKQTLKLMRQ